MHSHLTNFHPTREQWALGISVTLLLGLVYFRTIWGFASAIGKLRFKRRNKEPGIWVGQTYLTDNARVRQMHVVGATGVGKSTWVENLIQGDIERGYGVIIIDPKGDRKFYERVREICKAAGRLSDLHLLSATHLEESSRCNPFRLGNAAELQAKFFNAQEWSEPFFKKACEAALLQAFNELVTKFPNGFTVREFSEKLSDIASEKRDEHTKALFYDFFSMTEGPWAEILGATPPKFTKKEINFLDVTRKNEIVFIDLPTESQSVQSKRIGRILLQEIALISGLRKQYPHILGNHPISVIVDEFDAFATEQFATFLNKGRSSEFMITIAHQTLGDLDRVSPAFRDQIFGNPNIRVVFRQDPPDDAELWSRFFGTKMSTKGTYQTQDGAHTGAGSVRESQEFRFHPDEIKELKTGQCIISIKTDNLHRKIEVPLPKLPKTKLPVIRPEFISKSTTTESADPVTDDAVTDFLKQAQVSQESVLYE